MTRIVQAVSPAKVHYSTIMRPATASIPVSRATGGVSVVVPVVTVEGGSTFTVIAKMFLALAITVEALPPPTVTSGTTTLPPLVVLYMEMEDDIGLKIVLYCTVAVLAVACKTLNFAKCITL